MKKVIILWLSIVAILPCSLEAQNRELPKMPLYEIFSSSDCPNCAIANPTLNNVLDERVGKFVAIKNLEGFPSQGDPYYNVENDTRLIYYNLNSIPSMAVNGTPFKTAQNANSYKDFTTDLFDQYTTATTPLEIIATYTQTDQKKFDVSISLTSQTDLAGKLKLFVVLCEEKTVKNVKTNGETAFFHVVKKYINTNGSKGMSIANLTAGQEQKQNVTFQVMGDYRLPANGLNNHIDWSKEHSIEDFNNLKIAVFVQDSASKKVYQSAYAVQTNAGIPNESIENSRVTIYPNPANGVAYIDFTLNRSAKITAELYNLLGEQVKVIAQANFKAGGNTLNFDTSTLQKGIYFIRLQSNQTTLTKKITVN